MGVEEIPGHFSVTRSGRSTQINFAAAQTKTLNRSLSHSFSLIINVHKEIVFLIGSRKKILPDGYIHKERVIL